MTQTSDRQWNIPRRRSTSDQVNHYVINITPNNNTMNESDITTTVSNNNTNNNTIQEQNNRSLNHFPSDTTFVIHSDDGTEFALIPANNINNENNESSLNESLLPPLRSFETINIGNLSKHKRSLSSPFPGIFRNKSSTRTTNANANTSNHHSIDDYRNHLPNQIKLQRSDTLQPINNVLPPIESSTSRFSFITRNPSNQRRRSLRSLLRPQLSRPPTYKRYENPELEEQQERDMEALRRLQRHYNNDITINQNTNGLLDQFFYIDESDRPGFKKALKNTLINQFFGFYMAFWIVVFAFLGAISVFVPGLSPLAKLLWLPLALYIIGACIIIYLRYRQNKAVIKLEEQVDAARRRRVNELLTGMELPNDHYFVIEQNVNGHAHPVMKLIPPPPNYHSSTSSSTVHIPTTMNDQNNNNNNNDNGSLNLNHQNHSTVHIDLVSNSAPPSRSPSSASMTIRHQISHPNLIQSSNNNVSSSSPS